LNIFNFSKFFVVEESGWASGAASLNGIGKPVSAKASGISSASYCNSGINLPASFHLEFWIILVKKLLKQKEHFF